MSALKPLHAAIAFILVAVLSIVPIAFTLIPPMVDYPNHLARCAVTAGLPQSAALRTMYEPRDAILPDMAMDAIVVPLAHFMPIETAGRVFCAIVLLMLFTGGFALSWALLRRITVWSFVPALLLFNHILTFGFLNYLCGIGLLLWALAAWIAMRESPRGARIAVGAAFTLVLFFCHLMSMALFGCVLAGYEYTRWIDVSKRDKKALRLAVLDVAALFVAPFLFLLRSPTASEASQYHISTPWDKFDNVVSLLRIDPNRADILFTLMVAGGIAWLVRTKSIRLEPRMRHAIWVLIGTFLLLPQSLATCGCVDIRVPIAIAFMLAAGTTVSIPDPRIARYAVACLIGLFGFRVLQVSRDWSIADRESRQVLADLSHLPDRAVLFTAHEQKTDLFGVSGWEPPLIHLPVAELIHKPLFVPQLFALPNQHPLAIKPELRNLEKFEGLNPFDFEGVDGLANVLQLCREEADDMSDIPPALGRHPTFYVFAITEPGTEAIGPVPNARLILRRPRYSLFKLTNTSDAANDRWKNWIVEGKVRGPAFTLKMAKNRRADALASGL